MTMVISLSFIFAFTIFAGNIACQWRYRFRLRSHPWTFDGRRSLWRRASGRTLRRIPGKKASSVHLITEKIVTFIKHPSLYNNLYNYKFENRFEQGVCYRPYKTDFSFIFKSFYPFLNIIFFRNLRVEVLSIFWIFERYNFYKNY